MIDVIEITINEFKEKTMINILNYFQKMNKENEKKEYSGNSKYSF